MSNYISYPIDSNPSVLLQQAYSYIKQRAPIWQEHDGNLDTWILQAVSSMASDLRIMASDVPDTIFRYFGATILGQPPIPSTPAIAQSTWTAIDTLGHLIPAGALVGIPDGSGQLRGFRVVNDISILPGLNTTAVGEVDLLAEETGASSSGIGGPGTQIELIDNFDFVSDVRLLGPTTSGQDAETVGQYNIRLAEYMRNLSTRPILPEDFARRARSIAFRAVALDGYDPTNDTFFNERMVTVSGVDEFGLDLPDQKKQDLDDDLQAQREINFVVYVIDPSRTTINVTFTGVALVDQNPQEVEANAEANVIEYLKAANWGKDPTILTSGADRTWVETTRVRYNKVMQTILNTEGLDYVTSLQIGRPELPMGSDDIILDQPAALTNPGDISGTVSAP